MRCGISACATSACRSRRKRYGVRCTRLAPTHRDPEAIVLPGKSNYHRDALEGTKAVNDKSQDVAQRIADELASCGVKLVASLPDNWLMNVIATVDRDSRFVHVPVNREESAIGLCSC